MFDKYEILEYLLRNTFHNKKKSYTEVYEYFQVGSDDNDENVSYEEKKSISNFLTAMENAEKRIVREIKDNEIVPIYTSFIYRKTDNLPGIGFYDVFYNRNKKLYEEIAGSLTPQDVFNNHIKIKNKIFSKGMEILASDITDRFPDQDTIELFLAETRMYKDI